MKKILVAAILGLAATASVMAQGRIRLDSYAGSYPTVTYGAGANGPLSGLIGAGDGYTVGFYFTLTGSTTFTDASGIAVPGGTFVLATGTGSTAPFIGSGIYQTPNDFLVPGWVDPSGPISVVIVAYSGASYATSAYRGHSAAFNIAPTGGASFAVQTGTAQGAGFQVLPVPEPSTFALAGLGLAGLLIFRRRK